MRIPKIIRLLGLSALLLPLALTGCDSAVDGATVEPDEIVGLWEITSHQQGAQTDGIESGLFINVEQDLGFIGYLRYSGPAACFEQEQGFDGRFEPLGGDRYAIVYEEDGETQSRTEVTLARAGDQLTITRREGNFTHTTTLTQRQMERNACAFQLQGSYELEEVNGEPLPHTYTVEITEDRTQELRFDEGEAHLYGPSGFFTSLLVYETTTAGSDFGYLNLIGEFIVTTSDGELEITLAESISTSTTVAALATPTGLQVTLQASEDDEPLEFTFIRTDSRTDQDGSENAVQRLLGQPARAQ